MKPRLTPLNGLRAFETVARLKSFSRAAEELLVTQGAVSRQVKKLEDVLQMKLLHRNYSSPSLTEVGLKLVTPLSAAFASIDQTLQGLVATKLVLRLQVAPTFAIRWLMPRLARFTAENSSLDVRITTALRYHELDTHSFDAGWRWNLAWHAHNLPVTGVSHSRVFTSTAARAASDQYGERPCPPYAVAYDNVR